MREKISKNNTILNFFIISLLTGFSKNLSIKFQDKLLKCKVKIFSDIFNEDIIRDEFKKYLIGLFLDDKSINGTLEHLTCQFIANNKTIFHEIRYKIAPQTVGTATYYEKLAKELKKGKHSYIGDYTTVASKDTKIGAFCSIADNVCIGTTHHPVNYLSSHPFIYYKHMKLADDAKQYDYEYVTPVKIGNDVWIGKNAIIMDGIKINDGAIIGANAVVTHDVPPYAIVAGVPAKILKYRFREEQIKSLLKLK